MGVGQQPGARMGWLAVCLFSCLLGAAWSLPLDQETGPAMDAKDMEQLLTSLFIPHSRNGREIDLELENIVEEEEEEDVLAAKDTAAAAVSEEMEESDLQEIDRFNNYIDAIYKRMNAALRAKLMDPMVLNLQGKDKKEGNKKKVKDAKKRVDRDVEEEENIDETAVEEKEMEDESEDDSEVEIDHRAGEPKPKQKGNKKDKKEKREKNKNKKGKDKNKK